VLGTPPTEELAPDCRSGPARFVNSFSANSLDKDPHLANDRAICRRAGVRVAVCAAVAEPLCPRCGQPVSATAMTGELGDQLAAERVECPNCRASLARDVEGHADRGWRIDEEPNG
jgi:hypothetical protein